MVPRGVEVRGWLSLFSSFVSIDDDGSGLYLEVGGFISDDFSGLYPEAEGAFGSDDGMGLYPEAEGAFASDEGFSIKGTGNLETCFMLDIRCYSFIDSYIKYR